jgi:hypothetical protein
MSAGEDIVLLRWKDQMCGGSRLRLTAELGAQPEVRQRQPLYTFGEGPLDSKFSSRHSSANGASQGDADDWSVSYTRPS